MSNLRKNVFLTYFKPTVLLIATFCLGCLLANGVAWLLDHGQATIADSKPDLVNARDVFVLKNTVREGREILPEDVILMPQPRDKIPRGAVKTYQQIEGRTVKAELPKGTLLLDEFFAGRTAQGVAQGFIPPGFHSVAVKIYEPTPLGKNSTATVLAGDQVDIIIVQKDMETGDDSAEFVLLEKIPVLDALWEEIGDSPKHEKKGTVSLLLSDSQRKDLQAESQEGTRIRLRVCPSVDIQTVDMLPPPSYLDEPNPPISAQVGNRMQKPPAELPRGEIEIVIHDTPATEQMTSAQALRPVKQNELPTATFRGIPTESASVAQVSAIAIPRQVNAPMGNRSTPRYIPYYGIYGHNPYSNMQWQPVVPQLPVLVWEGNPNFETQARGVYREGNTYYLAPVQ